MPGDKYRSIKRPKVYRALRRQGMDKSKAAAIANAVANGTIDRKAKVFYDAHGNELDIRDDMIDWSIFDEDNVVLSEKGVDMEDGIVDQLVARVAALEEQNAALLSVTKAVAAAVVKEQRNSQRLAAAVHLLLGDLPEQVTEKARSVTHGDTSFDLESFSQWAQGVVKETSSHIPGGIEEFANFAMGKAKERPVPRT